MDVMADFQKNVQKRSLNIPRASHLHTAVLPLSVYAGCMCTGISATPKEKQGALEMTTGQTTKGE